MARQLECRLGVFHAGDLPEPFTLDDVPIERYLEEASRDDSGIEQLRFELNTNYKNNSVLTDDTPTRAVWLQIALRRLTENDPEDSGVRRVGVIYADQWPRGGVLGMMFDLGFNPTKLDPVADEFHTLPREGCAVFLEAIRKLRQNSADIHTETMFTTIHELGHVFNCWHIEAPFRLMSSSKLDAVATPPFAFDVLHQKFLRNVQSPEVWPGGSKFGSRADLEPSNRAFNNIFDLPRSHSALNLRIDIGQTEFWHFEPIEMDIWLKTRPEIKKTYYLPDTLDPGYEEFDVWIENPDGTTRRYRSPRLYCQNLGHLELSATSPFHRDLSIFAESGAYTFRKPGRHRLWATWVLPGPRVIESNRIEINIKSRLERKREYEELYSLLSLPKVAHLLYHRDGPYNSEVLKILENLASKTRHMDLKANLHYALGRYLQRTLERTPNQPRQLLKSWHEHVERALTLEDYLTPRRKVHAQRILTGTTDDTLT